MNTKFESIASATHPCKCCGSEARLFGVVDLNQYCGEVRQSILDPCGIPIYYHRCPTCGFVFTTAFDAFSQDDFRHWIYNEQYALIDPEYKEIRPRQMAGRLIDMFGRYPDLEILDYGGGNGQLARNLLQAGFRNVTTFDPFVAEFSVRPNAGFDLVVSFEVAEHAPQPEEIFRDMSGMLKPDGMMVFATQVQPPDFDYLRMHWWYIGPRNGHVSLYTPSALAHVARKIGFNYLSFDSCWHTMLRRVPKFAEHLVSEGDRR